MLFHVMVGSNDIERSKTFYDAVLGILGQGEAMIGRTDGGCARLYYRSGEGANFCVTEPIDGQPATVANGGTIAFACSSPDQVRLFHDTALSHGGVSIEDAPGPRDTPSGQVHLAYVRDPDGNKICAIYPG